MNAETKHTPGPWKYDGMWSLVMAGKYEIAAIHAARFAEDTKKRKRLDESQANARLIAAAPDLLEACKQSERLITQIATVANNPDTFKYWPGGLREEVMDWLQNSPAWAAIQKAESQS